MKFQNIVRLAGITLSVCLFLAAGAAAQAGTQAYLGDIIPLQGYSYDSPTVYLFLTGPNLPVNGVALNDISARADQGHFTQVDVDSDGHWEYDWGTGSPGGKLDAGTYTIWVVDRPNDRSRLSEAGYSTITVGLGSPGITLTTPGTPPVPGTMDLSSNPNGTSVVVNNAYKGRTPLRLEGLEPGTYNVTFSRFGYFPFSTPVKVESGSVSEVIAGLVQQTGGLAINTSPGGARVLIDGADAGISPVTLTSLTAGNHTMNVSTPGYTSLEQPVSVIANETREVSLVLVPVPPFSGIWAGGLVPAILIAGVIVVIAAVLYRRRH
jgi:hypothetical protein